MYVFLRSRSGKGHIHLWQFLLDLLTDKRYVDVIHWLTDDGEFKFAQPERVAELWGERKNKAKMNYEKLSRALRYYYEGEIIAKVRNFLYRHVRIIGNRRCLTRTKFEQVFEKFSGLTWILFFTSFKVRRKKFVYKFMCPLEDLVGYTVTELNYLVHAAARRLWSACICWFRNQQIGVTELSEVGALEILTVISVLFNIVPELFERLFQCTVLGINFLFLIIHDAILEPVLVFWINLIGSYLRVEVYILIFKRRNNQC